jgi:preprotein translocase subunit SecY
LVDKRALVVTAACLVIWRLLEQIPVSDVAPTFITTRLLNLSSGPGFFAAIGPNSLPFASWSIGFEGIGPYVEALVVMSVVTALSARLREMAGDPDGRASLARWTRVLAMVFALGQAYGLTVLYQSSFPPVFGPLDWSARLAVCLALAGGTALMILLADALDEFGLGFGYGAVIFYALGPLGVEVHRIAGYFAYAPSIEALYWPVAFWAACTVGLTVGGVAVLFAVRRVAGTELRVLTSGVLRPPQFALAVLFVPTIVGNYYSTTYPAAVAWFTYNWGPYGPRLWLDAAYLLVYAGLVILFALFVVAIDDRLVPVPSHLRPHLIRLAVLSGLFLALAVIGVPVAYHLLTQRSGLPISVSGIDVLLVVAVILFVVRAIEGYRPVVPFTASPSGLP